MKNVTALVMPTFTFASTFDYTFCIPCYVYHQIKPFKQYSWFIHGGYMDDLRVFINNSIIFKHNIFIIKKSLNVLMIANWYNWYNI